MKISCSKSDLLSGVNIVQKAVPSKTTMSILECILITASNGVIKLTANDMELGIETKVNGNISENGVISTDSDDTDILIAKPLREYLVNKSGKVDNDKVQKAFDKIQKSLKSHGYQAKSVNDIYHDERSSYYFAVVDGGKRIVILEDSYGDLYSGYIERQDKD